MTRFTKSFALLFTVSFLSFGFCCGASADSINYGDFAGTDVTYLDVTEDSDSDPVPLYGLPTVSANTLDFDPVSFNSFATGAGDSDSTDGNLTFMIQSNDVMHAIRKLLYVERGDYTLIGFGDEGTFVSVESTFEIDVEEIDNVPIAPITLSFDLLIEPSDGDFDLVNDPGPPVSQGNWAGDLTILLDQALVAASDLSLSDAGKITKVSVRLDNMLQTTSQEGTSALIAKKDFGGTSITVFFPEPSTFVMGLIGVAGSLVVLSRRKSAG